MYLKIFLKSGRKGKIVLDKLHKYLYNYKYKDKEIKKYKDDRGSQVLI